MPFSGIVVGIGTQGPEDEYPSEVGVEMALGVDKSSLLLQNVDGPFKSQGKQGKVHAAAAENVDTFGTLIMRRLPAKRKKSKLLP